MMRKLALPTNFASFAAIAGFAITDSTAASSANPDNSARLVTPVSSAAITISGVNKSVSKLETFPCSTAATRSSPMPVSIDGLGKGVSL